MGIIRNLIRTFIPTRSYQSFQTQKIKTSKFSVIRRKRKTSSISKALASISFFIAILCIFEAAVWFSTNFPEANNNNLRIHYLQQSISTHQPTSIENPFDIINSLINSLSILLLTHQFISQFNCIHYLHNKYLYLTDKSINKSTTNPILLTATNSFNWIVLLFLITLISTPKKTSKWNL
eukprot:372608_1